MLHVHDLSAGYAGSTVFRGVDLTVHPGRVHVIVGHNGAGKTTLLGAVMGLVSGTGGLVSLDGRDITGWPTHRRARAGIGLLRQDRAVFPTLTVAEHLTLLRAGRDPDRAWTVERITALFPRLTQRWSHRGGQLSGGEQQMLALATVLMAQPRLLLLDEPTEGLAPHLATQVHTAIRALADDGIGILLTTPNLAQGLAIADHIAVLHGGRIHADIDSDDEIARTDPATVIAATAPDTADTIPVGQPNPGITVHTCRRPPPARPGTSA